MRELLEELLPLFAPHIEMEEYLAAKFKEETGLDSPCGDHLVMDVNDPIWVIWGDFIDKIHEDLYQRIGAAIND